MLETNRVIWKEGMFLQPQHFQQEERFLLEVLDSRIRMSIAFAYGFTEVSVDTDSLANGLFALRHAAGVLPDGTIFEIPKKDPAPLPRTIAEHMGHERQNIDVHLALPLVQLGKTNVTTEVTPNVRYTVRSAAIADEIVGSQRKEIEVGVASFQYLFDDESLDNHTSMPVARLTRNSTGQVVLDQSYVPPLLCVGGSPTILNTVSGLLELLLAKISVLSQARRHLEGGSAQFTGAEETAFRLLQTLNTYTPLLSHHHRLPVIHPFDFFCYLTQFAGALCTFSSVVSIRSLPSYDHHNIGTVFLQLSKVIRAAVEADISAGSVTLSVEQIRPATYVARVPDGRLFSSAKFYLGVAADVAEKELIVSVVQRMKVCSQAKLDLLISSAMPGVALVHTSRPPENLSTKPGYHYFLLSQESPLWRDIQESGTVALYFPNTYQDLKLEIIALKQ